jgi:hypothetical protein
VLRFYGRPLWLDARFLATRNHNPERSPFFCSRIGDAAFCRPITRAVTRSLRRPRSPPDHDSTFRRRGPTFASPLSSFLCRCCRRTSHTKTRLGHGGLEREHTHTHRAKLYLSADEKRGGVHAKKSPFGRSTMAVYFPLLLFGRARHSFLC